MTTHLLPMRLQALRVLVTVFCASPAPDVACEQLRCGCAKAPGWSET